MGGLGNQLFQIFATISYSLDSSKRFIFLKEDKLQESNNTPRPTYWNTVFESIDSHLITDNININYVFREENFRYKNIDKNIDKNMMLLIYGYFQSYMYFQNNYKQICDLLKINEQRKYMYDNITRVPNLTQNILNNSISLHFRIGDYKIIQKYHPIMTKNYYKNALKHIIKNINYIPTILYFCEEQDISDVMVTIKYLKDIYPSVEFIRVSTEFKDWEQLFIMSLCKHNIIANSSFSWWGAYFNDNQDKIVCYPSVWFGPEANHNTCDLFPENWNCIHF